MLRAAFFDVDGTLTTTNVWRGLMAYFQERKFRRLVHFSYLAYHTPQRLLRRAGWISETDFRSRWAKDLAWYVRGFSTTQAAVIWSWITTTYLSKYWRADVLTILKEHLANQELVVLVSAGPQPLIQRIANELGVQHAIGTRFEVKKQIYTGRGLTPVCIDQYKASLTKDYLAQHELDVDFNHSIAYADSITDLPLLEMVGSAVAVYPDEQLKITARLRRWTVFPTDTPNGG